MADTLTFSLVPVEQEITFDALLKGVENVRNLVRAVDFAATRGNPRVWVVEKLRSSAPTIAIRPNDRDTTVIDTIVFGVAAITRQPNLVEPPTSFSEEAMQSLKKMNRLFRVGIRRIEISGNSALPQQQPARISGDIAERVDRIMRSGYSAWGSLDGELGALKVHGRDSYLTIWENISQQPIRCHFPPGRVNDVKELLQKKVRVIGRVNYYSNGRPRSIADFREIVDLTPKLRLARAYFGSIPDLTEGVDSVEYVKVMRR